MIIKFRENPFRSKIIINIIDETERKILTDLESMGVKVKELKCKADDKLQIVCAIKIDKEWMHGFDYYTKKEYNKWLVEEVLETTNLKDFMR